MSLSARVGLAPGAAFDADLPLSVKGRSLGLEARQLVQEYLAAPPPAVTLSIVQAPEVTARYVSLIHQKGETELFGVPTDDVALPTATEICLVKALSNSDGALVDRVFEGGVIGILNGEADGLLIANMLAASSKIQSGEVTSFNKITAVMVESQSSAVRSEKFEGIIIGSFSAYPRKFRFLELYRILENQYLLSIKDTLDYQYPKSPQGALQEALNAIQSELNQLTIIASRHKQQFEALFDLLKTHENSNRLAAALFRKVEQGKTNTEKHARGAALIYALRCAIVHAGTKDIIFESFADGDTLLGAVLEDVEALVCACNGIEIQE